MIVVAEGPSAAGKTTWCRRHADRFVGEYSPTGDEPDASRPVERADFWVALNSRRWSGALDIERAGIAICDGDPLKLHFSWTLARAGIGRVDDFEVERDAARRAISVGALGIADLMCVSIPSAQELRRQRDSDSTRGRRNFERHVLLREPLREWYQALESVAPQRVRWELPERVPDPMPTAADRTDVGLFDALIAALPG